MEDIIIVGYGGHAKSVADCIERQGKYHIVGYTDLVERDSKYDYLGNDGMLETHFNKGVRNVVLGIGYMGKGNLRERLYVDLKQMGFQFPVIMDPSAVVSGNADIDEGCFVGKLAVINAEAKIGKLAIINTKALVEHECVVSEYSHVAVGATLCGQVRVGVAGFVGANATVIQGMQIPDRTVIPAGDVVRKGYVFYK